MTDEARQCRTPRRQAGRGILTGGGHGARLVQREGFLFADRGEFVAKGFEEPVRVYEVSWRL